MYIPFTIPSLNNLYKPLSFLYNTFYISLYSLLRALYTIFLYGETFPRIWTKLGGNSSYKPPGASYTAHGPQKQSEIFKNVLFRNYVRKKYLSLYIYIYIYVYIYICIYIRNIRETIRGTLWKVSIFVVLNGCWGFLVVSKVPELYRKLREACRKNFPQVSSKSEATSPLRNKI